MQTKRKIAIVIVGITTFLTILFIWSNSLKPSSQSQQMSAQVYGEVIDALNAVFGQGTVTHALFRKFAHVFEFFVLGVEITILFSLVYGFKVKNLVWIFISGVIVAVIDESLQNVSKRTASITDVLIDVLGLIVAITITYATYYLINLKMKRIAIIVTTISFFEYLPVNN